MIGVAVNTNPLWLKQCFCDLLDPFIPGNCCGCGAGPGLTPEPATNDVYFNDSMTQPYRLTVSLN